MTAPGWPRTRRHCPSHPSDDKGSKQVPTTLMFVEVTRVAAPESEHRTRGRGKRNPKM